MPTKYTIIVKNKTGAIHRYLLFNEPPTEGGLGTPYSNVWQTAPGIPSPNGKAMFEFSANYYAVCGRTDGAKLGDLVRVTATDEAQVALCGTTNGDEVEIKIEQDGLSLVVPAPKNVTLPGSYGIRTGNFDGEQYSNAWCGIGRPNSHGAVVPCVTWRAKPNQKYLVTPVMKFYVGTGEYKSGQVVNKTTFSTIGEIDFTGKKQTVATITQDENNMFQPAEYSYEQSD